MRKSTNYLSPLPFILLLGLFLTPLSVAEKGGIKDLHLGTASAQNTGKEEMDSHYTQLMKQLKTKVDGWLKDLNQRIESEDVTRFEVRFLEILRSFLEWVGEKIDAQIESGEKIPKKKKTKGEEV